MASKTINHREVSAGMYLGTEEHSQVWQSAHVAQRAKSAGKYRELDEHFARVESWHDEIGLEQAGLDQAQATTASPPGGAWEAQSPSGPTHRGHRADTPVDDRAVEQLQRQMETERRRHRQLAGQWAAEKQVLQDRLEAATNRVEELEGELTESRRQLRAAPASQPAVETAPDSESKRDLFDDVEAATGVEGKRIREAAGYDPAMGDCRSAEELAKRCELDSTEPRASATDQNEFDTMIDRLVEFHLSKTKKWYMFWR